jgi:hypothetical protein
MDYTESGGIIFGPAQQINVVYAEIFATRSFTIDCHKWNEKEAADKTWTSFKIHFTAAHHQHKQIQGEYAAKSS